MQLLVPSFPKSIVESYFAVMLHSLKAFENCRFESSTHVAFSFSAISPMLDCILNDVDIRACVLLKSRTSSLIEKLKVEPMIEVSPWYFA